MLDMVIYRTEVKESDCVSVTGTVAALLENLT